MKSVSYHRAIISLFLVVFYLFTGVSHSAETSGSKAIDLPIRDYDGPGIGTLRNCTLSNVDCTPRRDCSMRNIDCTPTRDCTSHKSHDTRNCRACILRRPWGGCAVWGNDPFCEAQKAAQNAAYEADYAARKLDCERLKSSEKAACETRKSGLRMDCERIKSQNKLICETDKKAKQIDCEWVKSLQMAAGEIAEALIHESKKQIMPHARPIPGFIRSRLAPFFSVALLDGVRWATERGNVFSIPAKYSIEIKEAGAITLDNLIVFKHESAGLYDVGLWAHELEPVKQYQDLGIDHFAEYYADYGLNSEFVILRNFPFFTDGFNAANWQEPTAKTCPESEECKRYIGRMVNKIEALASAQSVYVCRTLDPSKTYQTDNIFNNQGVIIRKSLTACRPSYYDVDR